MPRKPFRFITVCAVAAAVVGVAMGFQHAGEPAGAGAAQAGSGDGSKETETMTVQYLEIVTPRVEETCAALSAAHGVTFGDPVQMLGNARTAELASGGRIGVRAPMRDTEQPVVRPYVLVDDIEAAVRAAVDAGAEVAIPPMQIPGEGTFAIYILGGIEHGLWRMDDE